VTTTLTNADGSTFEHGFEVMYTPKDAASILAISVRTLTKYALAGKIRCIKTAGGHRRFPGDAVRAASQGRWEDAAVKRPLGDMSPADVVVVVED
jgi:excisionase family DNA binding protein